MMEIPDTTLEFLRIGLVSEFATAPLLGGSTWHLDVGGLWLGVVSPFSDTCENLEIRAQAQHF